MRAEYYIDDELLDAFDDQNVELTSAVANIDDITKNLTDYTKTVVLPASDRNNEVFKHYYDADIDNTFDARVKVAGRIDLDGMPFKYGKWRLEKVSVKQGRPSAYTCIFWGNLVSLKDKFKNDPLSGLDLSEYDHPYNDSNVKAGLEGSLFSGNIIYNLFSKRRYYYNSDSGDNTQNETTANIAFGGGADAGVVWSDLKPAIRVARVVDAIAQKYGLVFSQDFLGRVEFTSLFLWLNADKALLGKPTQQLINWTDGNPTNLALIGFSLATDTWENSTRFDGIIRYWKYNITITPTDTTVPYTIIVKNFGEEIVRIDVAGGEFTTQELLIKTATNTPFSYQFFIEASNSLTYEAEISTQRVTFPDAPLNVTVTADSNSLVDTLEISQNMPNLKIIDFMKGLFQMFKLVVIADQYDNIYINTLNAYYAEGRVWDITPYVDNEQRDVERGKLLNQIRYRFQDPSTLLATQFKANNANVGYGDLEVNLTDEDGKPLDGDQLNYELPFEQFVYERLTDIDDNVPTNVVYAGIFDDAISPVAPKAHLFYNRSVVVLDKPVGFINMSGVKEMLSGSLNIPSHVFNGFSTTFGFEFDEYSGQLIEGTLYGNYHQDYIDGIFNIKRRDFTEKAILPPHILMQLRLNDVLKIRGSYRRMDSYTTNLLTGVTTFKLFNAFDSVISPFVATPSVLNLSKEAQQASVYVTNREGFTVSKVDDGFGTTWIDITEEGSNVYLDLEANTGDARSMTIKFTNNGTGAEVTTVVLQAAVDE